MAKDVLKDTIGGLVKMVYIRW